MQHMPRIEKYSNKFVRIPPTLLCALILSVVSVIIPFSTVYAQDAYGELTASSQAIVDAINQARANAGRAPLQVSSLLNLAAQSHANDVNAHRIFGHTGSDGSSVRIRVRRVGYNGDWVGENWILTSTPAEAMRWWLSDPPHAENIYHANYLEIGIGEIQDPQSGLFYWVTDFARNNGAPADAQVAASSAIPLQSSATTVRNVPPSGLDYTVQAGDTLLVIGLRHGLDWETLAEANGLTGHSILSIGQVIHIPGDGAVGSAEQSGTSSDYASSTYTGVYTIQAGDTLGVVAAKYAITWEELASINGLGEWSVLQIGQQIKVPGDTETASSSFIANDRSVTSDTAARHYTIQEGDTIFVIAIRNKLDWQHLLQINGMTESSILQPGQQIRLN